MSANDPDIMHENVRAEPVTNLQRLLSSLPAESLAAKLVLAREVGGGSDDALRKVLEIRLKELREAYEIPVDQEN